MAPKKNASKGSSTPNKDPLPSTISTTQSSSTSTSTPKPNTTSSTSTSTSTSTTTVTKPRPSSNSSTTQSPTEIAHSIYKNYISTTPARTKLIDIFMIFLMGVGAIQFLYCVVAGNYPFNAFLAGFGATVGQFVLTASLRIQTNVENEGSFKGLSPERAFADYVFGSLILHFFCVNFIN